MLPVSNLYYEPNVVLSARISEAAATNTNAAEF